MTASRNEIEAAAQAMCEQAQLVWDPNSAFSNACRRQATAALAAAEKVRELRRERRETYRRLVDAVNKATGRDMDNAAFRSGFIAGRDAALGIANHHAQYFTARDKIQQADACGGVADAIRALEPPK